MHSILNFSDISIFVRSPPWVNISVFNFMLKLEGSFSSELYLSLSPALKDLGLIQSNALYKLLFP